MDYRTLSEEKKIEHLETYSAALHKLTNRCQVLLAENYVLKKRLALLEGKPAEVLACLKAS